MRANVQHLGLEEREHSFECYWVKAPRFGFHWHYHRALEITYVVKGRGTRLVGDNVAYFEAGDLVLLGSNLPHTWISDDEYNEGEDLMEVIVLQFLPELFHESWLALPEMRLIRQLLQKANRGIVFSESIGNEAGLLLTQLVDQKHILGLQTVLGLFGVLSEEKQPLLLSSKGYAPSLNDVTEERLRVVCQYLHEHYTERITLATLAKLANMNASSFCRFFTKMTGQTVTEYLNDLRIGKACNLLIDQPALPISQIAYLAGYNSQTLFNRNFRRKKGSTPSAFRERFIRS